MGSERKPTSSRRLPTRNGVFKSFIIPTAPIDLNHLDLDDDKDSNSHSSYSKEFDTKLSNPPEDDPLEQTVRASNADRATTKATKADKADKAATMPPINRKDSSPNLKDMDVVLDHSSNGGAKNKVSSMMHKAKKTVFKRKGGRRASIGKAPPEGVGGVILGKQVMTESGSTSPEDHEEEPHDDDLEDGEEEEEEDREEGQDQVRIELSDVHSSATGHTGRAPRSNSMYRIPIPNTSLIEDDDASQTPTLSMMRMDKFGFIIGSKDEEDDETMDPHGDPAHPQLNLKHEQSTPISQQVLKERLKKWEEMLTKVNGGNGGVPIGSGSGAAHPGSNGGEGTGGGGGPLNPLNPLSNSPMRSSNESTQSIIKNFARKGIPDSMRQRAWAIVTGVDTVTSAKEGEYLELVEKAARGMAEMSRLRDSQRDPLNPRDQRENNQLSSSMNNLYPTSDADSTCSSVNHKRAWEMIERDIRRTFPKHYLFHDQLNESDDFLIGEESAHGDHGDSEHKLDGVSEFDRKASIEGEGGQAALRRLLTAYSVYDSDVGYCQGMNFIAAMFLTFLPEEESFWMLVAVMNEEPYKLRELFGEDMAGTHEVLYIAERLTHHFLPKLYKHLENERINISMFVTQWLMTIYTSTFPFELVARVWDSFLVEGWKVVYRVMLALLEDAQQDLMEIHFEEILAYLREFPAKVDGPKIMENSLKISLKRKHIQKYANEYRSISKNGEFTPKHKHRLLHRHNDDNHSIDESSIASSRDLSNFNLKFVPKLRNARKEIVVDDLSMKLIPIIGTCKFAVMLYNVLSPEECSDMIARAEEEGFEEALIQGPNGQQILRTDIRSCQRCMIDDDPLAEDLFERIAHALKGTEVEKKFRHAPWIRTRDNKTLHATGFNERLRFLRYDTGHFFAPHQDNHFRRGPEFGDRAGETSHVTDQIYLNEKCKGGMTRMKGGRRYLDVIPKTGAILLFDHDILHEGCKVTGGQKYIIRTDIMYSNREQGVP